jgi:hypothetical protein
MKELVDAHIHLYGALSPENLFELGKDRYLDPRNRARIAWCQAEYQKVFARPQSIASYWETSDGFERLRQDYLMDKAGNFAEFQARFNLIIALCGIHDPEDMLVARTIFVAQRQQGIQSAQYRMILPPLLPPEHQREFLHNLCLLAGSMQAESAGVFRPFIAVSLPRDNHMLALQWPIVRDLRLQSGGEFLTAIDFCQDECSHPPREKSDFIALLHQFNRDHPDKKLELLYHVGETFSGLHILSSLRWVWEVARSGADRLGHCLSLGLKASLVLGKTYREPRTEALATLDWLMGPMATECRKFGLAPGELDERRRMLLSNDREPWVSGIYDDTQCEFYRAMQDIVMGQIRDETSACIEVCPTSNLRIGGFARPQELPYWRFKSNGMRMAIGTDDPGIFSCDLRGELAMVGEHA